MTPTARHRHAATLAVLALALPALVATSRAPSVGAVVSDQREIVQLLQAPEAPRAAFLVEVRPGDVLLDGVVDLRVEVAVARDDDPDNDGLPVVRVGLLRGDEVLPEDGAPLDLLGAAAADVAEGAFGVSRDDLFADCPRPCSAADSARLEVRLLPTASRARVTLRLQATALADTTASLELSVGPLPPRPPEPDGGDPADGDPADGDPVDGEPVDGEPVDGEPEAPEDGEPDEPDEPDQPDEPDGDA